MANLVFDLGGVAKGWFTSWKTSVGGAA